MLYEALIRTPAVDAYGKHQFIERQFKERGVATRKYTWTFTTGRMAIVRYFEPIGDGFTWTPLDSPPENSKIRFRLCAHVRQPTTCVRASGNGFRSISNIDYYDNIQWLENKADLIGVRFLSESIDVNPLTIPIVGKKADSERVFNFRLRASQFEGVATIVNAERFAQALATSVGNAKAFGLGFIMFSMFGRGFQNGQ
jgi:hypothetical protein